MDDCSRDEPDRAEGDGTGRTRRRRMAIGGDGDCDHAGEELVDLGLGGPLLYRRCPRCDAVIVASVDG